MKTPALGANEPNPTTRLRNRPVIDRVMYRTALLPTGCWEWRGSTNTKGYGHVRGDLNGSLLSVHRVAFLWFNGSIPDHREVDHTCLNRACVNPAHLELVTHAENVRRGRHNQNHGKSACDSGHDFSAENTSIDTLGKRVCKACARERTRAYRARRAGVA